LTHQSAQDRSKRATRLLAFPLDFSGTGSICGVSRELEQWMQKSSGLPRSTDVFGFSRHVGKCISKPGI
jgi:hypothetical protein